MSVTLLAVLLAAAPTPADSFPHAAHRRLFASCTTCHGGIISGDSAAARPPAASCAACHDGAQAAPVNWAPGPPRPTNLRFDHRAHGRAVAEHGDSAIACVACHAERPTSAFMEAGRAAPAACFSCHAHRAPSHFAAVDCAACHRPLRSALRLAAADIGRFSKPPSHDRDYVFRHAREAAEASCAFCHTRESCAACHVNAGRLTEITALGSDARVAALVGVRARIEYPTPASHRAASFPRAHGVLAGARGATCANCHARESCLGCHRAEERLGAIAALPRRTGRGARGVDLADARPRDHGPGFAARHRVAAAGGDQSCGSCHAPSYCASCHDAAAAPGFHGANYVARHGAESFGTTTECASCHQPEAFCVTCHRETGRASQTGAAPGKYHDAQQQWTFAHGAVARRSIETCAGCHRQTDCLQCHSASGGWRVNPHGRGFDARMGSKNRAMCTRCHVNGPPRG